MSDHSSAGLFGLTFRTLAKIQKRCPGQKAYIRKLAREIYQCATEYDFSDYQMYADNELVALGLARVGKASEDPEFNPNWGDDPNEKIVIYANDEHF